MTDLDYLAERVKPGDTVCFTDDFQQYLAAAGRWPSIHIPRTAMRGTVRDVRGTLVTVLWPTGQGTHYADHLDPCTMGE